MRIIMVLLLLLLSNTAYADRCRDDGWMDAEKDKMGIKRSCIAGTPMAGWRSTLTRLSTDAFETQYSFQIQYCWLPWFETCNSWGSGYNVLYEMGDVTNATPPTNTGGKWIHSYHVCLKRFVVGDTLLHDDTVYAGKQPLICAYMTLVNDCTHPFWSWHYSLLGCVNEPVNPEPPTFNPSIVTAVEPYIAEDAIEKYVDEYYSTFDQPVVKLILPGAMPSGADAILFLRYKFFGDATAYPNYPNTCAPFSGTANNTQYCAVVRPEMPGKVCACAQDRCDLKEDIGCIDRPTPEQSKYAIAAKYVQHYDAINKVYTPAALPMFVNTVAIGTTRTVKYRDNKGRAAYYDKDKSGYYIVTDEGTLTNTPAEFPVYYDKLPLPAYGIPIPVLGDISDKIPEEQKIREYYIANGPLGQKIYTKDISLSDVNNQQTYYVPFSSIIAEMENENIPKTVTVMTPESRMYIDECGSYNILETDNGVPHPLYYVPTGNRDRAYCGPDYCKSNKDWICPIKVNKPCNSTPPTIKDSDIKAENAVCPGIYLSVKDITKPEKICVMTDGGWKVTTPYDRNCDEMPIKCSAIDSPSPASGYAVWENLEGGKNDTGTCKANYGFTNKISYTYSDPALQAKVKALQLEFDQYNMNISKSALPAGGKETIITPTRDCVAGTFTGKITGECKIAENCEALEGSTASGNANWPKIPAPELPKSSIEGPAIKLVSSATGTCIKGYKQSPQGAPTMKCVTTVQYKDKKPDEKEYKDIDFSFMGWEMKNIQNPCIPE